MTTIENIIEGLKIFNKYNGDISAEHDVIYAGPSRMQNSKISEDDVSKLIELGWGHDGSTESWYHFV